MVEDIQNLLEKSENEIESKMEKIISSDLKNFNILKDELISSYNTNMDLNNYLLSVYSQLNKYLNDLIKLYEIKNNEKKEYLTGCDYS